LVSGGSGVSPEVAKPVPLHLGQTTNPFRLLLAQALHVPITTQDSLRASPVPLHSGHATSRFPPQRGHCSLTSPTGIPPSCPVQSSINTDCAQSAVSVDRLYVILPARTTPCPFLPARGLSKPASVSIRQHLGENPRQAAGADRCIHHALVPFEQRHATRPTHQLPLSRTGRHQPANRRPCHQNAL